MARPDFDAVGGSSGSSLTFHGLIGSPEWKYCRLPSAQNSIARWETVFTGDPYTALFVQMRRNVPLRSLSASFQAAWNKLQDLPDIDGFKYDLLSGMQPEVTITNVTTDPDNPDLVQKTFCWKFTPKGSSKEVEQTIKLSLSKSRFEYYRQQPRLNGRWNVYAEVEMPEVRDLATEFQKLHAQHKWSTFNQAFNVLKSFRVVYLTLMIKIQLVTRIGHVTRSRLCWKGQATAKI